MKRNESGMVMAWLDHPSQEKITRGLVYVGVVLGVALILIALAVDIMVMKLNVGLPAITQVYRAHPVQWIILTSPFFLGTIFYFVSLIVRSWQRSLQQLAAREKLQFNALEQFISHLDAGRHDGFIGEEFTNKALASRLHAFRDKLQQDKVAEERRIWESSGLADFADLLRSHTDVDKLGDEVIRFIVKSLSLNQGSVFLYNSNSGTLDLKACYAFDRKKFLTKQIPVGNGLVGQCYLEKEPIILHHVPDDYVKITSGLGMATPTFLALIPMKTEDVVTGIIEIAGFRILEPHQIRFLENAAAAFSSVIRSVTVNDNIRQLLVESQQQTEELKAQEEEMKQNLEELKAVEEQLSRQLSENERVKKDLEEREQVLSKTTILSESDLHGTITFVNSKFCEVSQYSVDELVGKGHNIVRHPDMPKEIFRLMWTTIKKGETFRGIVKNRKKDGSAYWVDATLVPVMENNQIVKYIGARYHIRDEAMAQKLFDEQLVRLGVTLPPAVAALYYN